jgi:hypothetical protein
MRNSKRGSTAIEAAIIIPILILIIMAMLKLAIGTQEKVRLLCLDHEAFQAEMMKDTLFNTEDALRTGWMLAN